VSRRFAFVIIFFCTDYVWHDTGASRRTRSRDTEQLSRNFEAARLVEASAACICYKASWTCTYCTVEQVCSAIHRFDLVEAPRRPS